MLQYNHVNLLNPRKSDSISGVKLTMAEMSSQQIENSET